MKQKVPLSQIEFFNGRPKCKMLKERVFLQHFPLLAIVKPYNLLKKCILSISYKNVLLHNA
ncbi:hypothetical protein JOC86_003137 [Bacillus pakistanensis]|uniref:Uncharacterized protein n=1 Tax=Rossellomorea pakistanensis TaxID=992288 RepID=A0ABS2NFI4_9BACI|nr:hypothetical protein [Bacillus pakistanensis]